MIKFRSNCPLGRTLDILGDKWTLLVLRDIIAFEKTTFKELALMPENIATNILTGRLNKLVEEGFVTKQKSKTNKLVNHYLPTAKAIELVPAVMIMKDWSIKHLYADGAVPAPIGKVV